jgi:hypothetical protein
MEHSTTVLKNALAGAVSEVRRLKQEIEHQEQSNHELAKRIVGNLLDMLDRAKLQVEDFTTALAKLAS